MISGITATTIGRNSSYSDTTSDGKQVFLAIGDSNGDGRGTTLGPTTISGTMFLWNGSSLTTITTADISNGGAGNGTFYKQFALNYNARTGFNPVIVQQSLGGSNFYPDGDNNNWYTSGNLYTSARTQALACLASLSINRLKGIIITLGINDNRAGTSLANIQTGITSLFTRLRTDYPGVPIIINQVGRSEVGAPSGEETFQTRLYTIRGALVEESKNNGDTYLLGAPNTGIGITGHYNVDNLHYSQVMNNFIGAQIDRVYANKDTYSKWATNVISTMYDELSSGRKAAIATFIDAEIANGNFFKMEFFSYFKTTIQENCFIDWTFQGYLFNNTSVGFLANTYLSSNGTTNQYGYTYLSGINTKSGAGQNDFINGVFVLDNLTASGTSATLFGGGPTAAFISVGQNTTPNETWRSNDLTISTYATEGSFADGNFYGTGRDSGTKYLYKGSSQVASASVASTASNVSVLPVLGGFNNNGTVSSRISAQYQFMVAAPLTTFNLSAFLTNMNTLISAW